MHFDLNSREEKLFQKLHTPTKIQDYINNLGAKKESKDTYIVRSPRLVIENGTANCIEGALLALAVCAYHKIPAFLLDLKVGVRNTADADHVVTLFKLDGHYGALSKTHHAVLRYREPVYKSVRELAMSYFHEYFLDTGVKTMRSFSESFDVIKKFGTGWIIAENDIYEIAVALDEAPHTNILNKKMEHNLRKADRIEIKAGKIVE